MNMITKSLLVAATLTGTVAMSIPASAMPIHQGQSASSLLQLSSWADRVRGRTSSSTGEVGYGYGYGRGYPAYTPYGYNRAPYGYEQAPAEYQGGYDRGYGAY